MNSLFGISEFEKKQIDRHKKIIWFYDFHELIYVLFYNNIIANGQICL